MAYGEIEKELVTFEEMKEIIKYTTVRPMLITERLYEWYRITYSMISTSPQNEKWIKMRLLTFMYLTGRIQGIREERQRQKNSQN